MSTVTARLEEIIEKQNLYDNPAPAARNAVSEIEDEFLVIHIDELPEVKLTGWGKFSIDRINYSENASPEDLRTMALRDLAAARHIERVQAARKDKWKTDQEAAKAKELDEVRYNIYAELFEDLALPRSEWGWDKLRHSTKRSVTTVLDLRTELASTK